MEEEECAAISGGCGMWAEVGAWRWEPDRRKQPDTSRSRGLFS